MITSTEEIFRARPGRLLKYHEGLLAADRKDNPALHELALGIMRLEQRGIAEPVQRRLGRGRFAYFVFKRERLGRPCHWPLRHSHAIRATSEEHQDEQAGPQPALLDA